jgi:histidine triad (HIT) family protein
MARRDWYCEDVLWGKLAVDVVYDDDLVLAFHHPKPTAEIHVVVIPKEHITSLLDPKARDGDVLTSMITAIQETARKLDLEKSGFYVRSNVAGEGVTPHMHWHIYGPGIP